MSERCPLKESDALATLPINECGRNKCAWWNNEEQCCAVLLISKHILKQ